MRVETVRIQSREESKKWVGIYEDFFLSTASWLYRFISGEMMDEFLYHVCVRACVEFKQMWYQATHNEEYSARAGIITGAYFQSTVSSSMERLGYA